MDWDKIGITALFVICIILIICGFYYDSTMIDECIADGHKRYECTAMLSSNISSTRIVYMKDIK